MDDINRYVHHTDTHNHNRDVDLNDIDYKLMDLNIIHQPINQPATNKSTMSTTLTALFSKTSCTDCIDIVLATDMKFRNQKLAQLTILKHKLNPKINKNNKNTTETPMIDTNSNRDSIISTQSNSSPPIIHIHTRTRPYISDASQKPLFDAIKLNCTYNEFACYKQSDYKHSSFLKNVWLLNTNINNKMEVNTFRFICGWIWFILSSINSMMSMYIIIFIFMSIIIFMHWCILYKLHTILYHEITTNNRNKYTMNRYPTLKLIDKEQVAIILSKLTLIIITSLKSTLHPEPIIKCESGVM